ncbi:DUF2071 domain-containing protein [Bacillus tianshenii]|nr:DUF2071 domain-containing protein [Bacillus tianshenii]
MFDELSKVDHRPYALPVSSWVMTQTWEDLLFMHWPLPVDVLRPFIPEQLEVDTFDGKAWIAVVPFYMNHIQLRGLPEVPGARSFLELNVRTYVKYRNQSGVYFFSLDANHLPAVMVARSIFHLPYLTAKMTMKKAESAIQLASVRSHRGFSKSALDLSYRPVSESYSASYGSIEHWLTERYCLFTVKKNNVYRGDIHHIKWSLQVAEADIRKNTLVPFIQEQPYFNEKPLLHYSKHIRAFIYPMSKVKG